MRPPSGPKGKRIQHPTARWVFHDFVGIHVLSIPGQGLIMLHLTDEHQHLLLARIAAFATPRPG
jgi:hypothetical protein